MADPTISLNLQSSNPWSALLGGIGSAIASPLAAGAANQGEQNMIGQQGQIEQQLLNTWNPQYVTGVGANAGLQSILGLNGQTPNYAAFENSPSYLAALTTGDQAINRSAAASGNAFSSNTLADLGNFNAMTAAGNYNNYVTQLMQAAGLGNSANQGLNQATLATGNNIGQGLVNQGGNNAAGITGQIGGIAQGLGALLGGGSNNGAVSSWLQNMLYPVNPSSVNTGQALQSYDSNFNAPTLQFDSSGNPIGGDGSGF
jgi:hypothetical protein